MGSRVVKAIKLKNISFRYSGRTESALKNINMEIQQKEKVLILGRSGSGKSSLLRTINGLIPHFYTGDFSGNLLYFEEDITHLPARERFRLGIATVLQFPEDQILGRKVWRSVAFGLSNFAFPREEILRRVKWALKLVGMLDYYDTDTASLSSGQKQKVALASALAMQPRVLLLDEPTSQLDPYSARRFLLTLTEIQEDYDITLILSEHRTDDVIDFVDKVIVIRDGSIILDDKPEHVFSSSFNLTGIKRPLTVILSEILSLSPKKVKTQEFLEILKQKESLIRDKLTKILRAKTKQITKKTKEKPILELNNVWFRYSKKEKWIIKGISFRAYSGEIICIMGPNGAGKSTLAKLITGFIKPDKGKIIINGVDLTKKNFRDIAGFVAYAPQNPEDLLFNNTVFDEISFPLRMIGYNKKDIEKFVDVVSSKFELKHLLYKSPYTLSGGEKLRTILASMLVMKPAIFILDEPTRGLDWASKVQLMRELNKMRDERTLVILITHDVELIADSPIDRVLVINNGEIYLQGPKEEVLASKKLYDVKLVRPKICEILEKIGITGIISISDINGGNQ